MSEGYTLERLKDELTPVFQKNKVRKATLFGSCAKKTATKYSDVDLLVDSGLRGLRYFGLVDDVCEALGCDVDMIDTADVIPGSPVENEIKRTGIVLYEQ